MNINGQIKLSVEDKIKLSEVLERISIRLIYMAIWRRVREEVETEEVKERQTKNKEINF